MTCPRTAKWFGACRFEARYDEPVIDMETRYPLWTSGHVVRPAAPMKVYIHDICVVCGKVVERTKEGK